MNKGLFLASCLTVAGVVNSFVNHLAPPQSPRVFKAGVDTVWVDVSVLDKDRRPVRGLTPTDFQILEDGKPQEITVFESVDVPDVSPPPVGWQRDVTPDVTTNEVRTTRVFVIVVDDALIPTDPRIINSSRGIAEGLIDHLGPSDLAAVVFTADSRRSQDFTSDRAKLRAAFDKFNPGFATWEGPERGPDPDNQFRMGTVETLRNVIATLGEIPQVRKAVLWITPGVPARLENVAPVRYDPKNPGESMERNTQLQLVDMTKDMLAQAKRSSVPIYPIDPTGLGGLAFWARANNKAVVLAGPAMDFVMMTAANTSARAIVNTNEFDSGISAIFEENDSYYLIGYSPSNTARDGTTRRVQVKTNRPGVEVRARNEYIAPNADASPPTTARGILSSAVAKSIPVRDLPLRATVAAFATLSGGNPAVVVALGVRQPVPSSAANGRVTVTTELQTSAYNTEGNLRGTERHTAKVVLRAGAKGDADYETLSRINLPPGRYQLRLAAYHELTGQTGTVSVDVVVPDFARDLASISGVIVNVLPGRPSAPRDLFRDILSLVPTAQRTFAPTDQVSAMFYLYQNAGKPMFPAEIAIRVLDDKQAMVLSDIRTINVDAFVGAGSGKDNTPAIPRKGGTKVVPTVPDRSSASGAGQSSIRAAEVRYPLSVSQLPAGVYLLTFEARVGTVSLRRDVQFEVRR